MTSNSSNSTPAFELFFRYSRSKLLLQNQNNNTSVADATPSEGPFTGRNSCKLREAYKSHVKKLLKTDIKEVGMTPNLVIFREHISHRWKLADESTKSVFRELVSERQDGNKKCNDSSRKWNQQASPSDVHKDNISSHCPFIHSHSSNQPRKRMKMSPVPPIITISECSDSDEKRSDECGSMMKRPMLVKLTGIISFIDKKDDVIGLDDVRSFLTELGWDRLHEGEEK